LGVLVIYVSPFWSGFFFNYLSFDEAKNLNTPERMKLNNGKVISNLSKGSYTLIGLAYKEMNLNPLSLLNR
jgi:hypothetical protein